MNHPLTANPPFILPSSFFVDTCLSEDFNIKTSSSRNNDASMKEIDSRAGGGGGRGGGGVGWWTVLMVPMRLGDVLSMDL